MKQKILSSFVLALGITAVHAQQQKITGYAITGIEKGQSGWKQVRLIDINSGAEIQSIFTPGQEAELLNARTGKPIIKKEPAAVTAENKPVVYTFDANNKIVPLNTDINTNITTNTNTNGNRTVIYVRGQYGSFSGFQSYKPFASNSAACAYDKKHERLYYTPMGINQLRYIDLKSKTPKIYYFEDEAFGVVTGMGDVQNQVTRMVIGADGNGYALTNDANHLIRFTTGKKPTITDLGALVDDPSNTNYTVHARNGFGGDMIADADGNLYLIMANKKVYKITVDTKVATYVGTIKGLPQGYNTNGAMVESGSKVIVCSSESTAGYFRFDLNTMQSEKVSTGESVFNASDLANGNLAFDKKDEKKKEEPVVKEAPKPADTNQPVAETVKSRSVNIYPNPVSSNGTVKISFTDQTPGKYQVQLVDLYGQLAASQGIVLSSKVQVAEIKLPALIAKGTYVVKLISEDNSVVAVGKLVVQ